MSSLLCEEGMSTPLRNTVIVRVVTAPDVTVTVTSMHFSETIISAPGWSCWVVVLYCICSKRVYDSISCWADNIWTVYNDCCVILWGVTKLLLLNFILAVMLGRSSRRGVLLGLKNFDL